MNNSKFNIGNVALYFQSKVIILDVKYEEPRDEYYLREIDREGGYIYKIYSEFGKSITNGVHSRKIDFWVQEKHLIPITWKHE